MNTITQELKDEIVREAARAKWNDWYRRNKEAVSQRRKANARPLTDEQKAAKRARQAAWYQANKDKRSRKALDLGELLEKREADRAYYAKNRSDIRYRQFLRHRKDTPEQIEERRAYNRAAAARYRRNKALDSTVV